jgi:transcriptional regulator with XRE-family HTH domain
MSSISSGPVLAGWILGKRLAEARKAAERKLAETTRVLEIHETTLRRWENAEVVPGLIQLNAVLDFYGAPEEVRAELRELRARAAEPGYWNGSGPWPSATAELLNMELAAVRRRSWDLTAVPGLLQTPEVARAIMQSVEPHLSPPQLDRAVDLRMLRQLKVAEGPTREVIYLIGEEALARLPGTLAARRAQLVKLLSRPPTTTIQVLPFRAGPHLALGSFLICEFDSEQINSAVFVEGSVSGRSYTETKDIHRYETVWTSIHNKALGPEETVRFLRDQLEGMTDDE